MKTEPLPRAWYVVRTAPGAQLPRREYVTEPTRSRKGYRIVSSMDENLSAVEKALGEAGFTYYMPAERRLLRDRMRPYLWKHRRFAMFVGYVFVHAPRSIAELEAVPGVIGILRTPNETALTMSVLDVLKVRTVEARAEAEFMASSNEERQRLRRAAKEDPSLRRIVAELDVAGEVTVKADEVREAAVH